MPHWRLRPNDKLVYNTMIYMNNKLERDGLENGVRPLGECSIPMSFDESSEASTLVSLSELIVLGVLDLAAPSESIHTRIDKVQPFLSFGNTTASSHVQSIEKVRVSIVQFATNRGHRTGCECSERFLLSSSKIAQYTNILRENVFTDTLLGSLPPEGHNSSTQGRKNNTHVSSTPIPITPARR